MRAVEGALARFAESDRTLVRVLDGAGDFAAEYTYRQITRAARALADELAGAVTPDGRTGVLCGNTPEFVVADLALLAARATEVPVPLAFTREQAASLLEEAEVCVVDALGAARLAEWGRDAVLPQGCRVVEVSLDALAGAGRPYAVPAADEDWICKIIHTSGTTSRPKGVRIRSGGIGALIDSLHAAMPADAFARYLSVVPFSLLIEQVTGLYLVLLDGGCVTLLPPTAPLVGTSGSAVEATLPHLVTARTTAVVATPALVNALADAARRAEEAGQDVNQALFGTDRAPLICCGGAPVHPDTLRELDGFGIPVYEGYGLSENSSVVSWNTPGARRIGTVGRPLRHVRVRLSEEGEVLVSSPSLFAGYTRPDPSACAVVDGWLHTGDLASIDEDGFLRITGRQKNVIITAAGRNVAPEWVEAQYARLPFVRAAAVVGNDLPALNGLFVIDPAVDRQEAEREIAAFGAEHLSQVERVEVVHLLSADDEAYRRLFTVTGRPVRGAIAESLLSHPRSPIQPR
ncbi:AMP-binding protein [Streptomyces sp. NBC_01565]|uniref:AMP-binding protein n=1 Tax=Streptomyces sp. NBC_01565 TaxID=2975881 RepID=UPI00224F4EF6|nr:AMP-binding protein [Streptomyces sp. NBC_01565]MCX4545878.1 AMP-binding protein [Streptomyces sp. NBC_01565]